MAGIGVLLFGFVAVIGEMVPMLLVLGAVFLGIAVMAAQLGNARRWPWAVVAVAAVLLVVGNIEPLIYDLSHPEEAPIFILNVLALGLAALGLIAGIVAFRGRPLSLRPITLGVGSVVAVASIFSLVAMLTLDGDDQQVGDVAVMTEHGKFPERIEVTAGSHWFYLENRDRIRHTFVVDSLDINMDMPSVVSRREQATLAPGEYEFYCDVPMHESMRGTLVVTDSVGG
jgi:plastocyanin